MTHTVMISAASREVNYKPRVGFWLIHWSETLVLGSKLISYNRGVISIMIFIANLQYSQPWVQIATDTDYDRMTS